MRYIILFLSAILLANISSAHFGPGASILNAFLFIGLDLSSRDRLHDAWQGQHLALKMAALFTAGAVITWAVNKNAAHIALASLVAFACTAIIDAVVYQALHKHIYMIKVNGSNILSAFADSLIFPTLAFGHFLPLVIVGQFIAKASGGFIWAIILKKGKDLHNG